MCKESNAETLPIEYNEKSLIRDAQHQNALARKLSKTDFSLTEKLCKKKC